MCQVDRFSVGFNFVILSSFPLPGLSGLELNLGFLDCHLGLLNPIGVLDFFCFGQFALRGSCSSLAGINLSFDTVVAALQRNQLSCHLLCLFISADIVKGRA